MPFWISKKKFIKDIQASTIKEIQASLEGQLSKVELESLLTGTVFTNSIPGTENYYKNYVSQVREVYKKYNGQADFGVAQTRAVVDLRTAMISGEGISIGTEDEQLAEWIDDFLTKNEIINGRELSNGIKGTEMAGQLIFNLKVEKPDRDKDKEEEKSVFIRINRLGYNLEKPFRVRYKEGIYNNTDISHIEVKNKVSGLWEKLSLENFIYIRTGGDDLNLYDPTTKVGVVLTDIENYDRCIKDMRQNNHILARITPYFETKTDNEAKTLRAKLAAIKWKIGQAIIGTAKFSYATPGTGAHDNLKTEMFATIKNISGTTGVPVHWLGHADLMSNRSTAETLYEVIKQHTIIERTIWEGALYNLILKAQELYIDNGGTDLKFNKDFQVKIPLIDFAGFLKMIQALEIAYRDGAISKDDYMNLVPGIDPYKTKKAIAAEMEEEGMELLRNGIVNPKTDNDLKNNSSEED